jgi:2-oxoglutarate ferredoxin oxidoreductase subunit beta
LKTWLASWEELIFERPQAMADVPTLYCPRCTYGVIHRIVAESIDNLGAREKTAGVAPVGCSVLMYNYFNTVFLKSPHGRAPATATRLKRVRPQSGGLQ